MRDMHLEKSDLILLLIYGRGAKGKFGEPIQGITRLMKLLFLLDRETDINKEFSFTPYKMGPFSSEVYPELEFLRNFPSPENPLVKVGNNGASQDIEISPEQIQFVDDIQFDEAPLDNSEVDVGYQLTDVGKKVAKEIWNSTDEKIKIGIEEIKNKYGNLPLRKLLRYVYESYPAMIINSEIKDQVLQ